MGISDGPPEQALRAQLDRLKAKDSMKGHEAARTIELVKLGQSWSGKAVDGESQLMEELGRSLRVFLPAQQQEIVEAFAPLRASIERLVLSLTTSMNTAIAMFSATDTSCVVRTQDSLQVIDSSPQLRWYKKSGLSANSKVKFLLALSCVMACLEIVQPTASALFERLKETFFVVPDHGDVLSVWRDARLECYDAAWMRAGQRALSRYKRELQAVFVAALKAAGNTSPLEFQDWPMSRCPLAKAFSVFVKSRRSDLGDIAILVNIDCPAYTLQRPTLQKVLGKFGVLDVRVDQGKRGAVMLRSGTRLVPKAVGSRPKSASVAQAMRTNHRAEGSVKRRGVSPSVSITGNLDTDNLAIVMRGLAAGDEDWSKAWHAFCRQKRVIPDLSLGTPPSDVVAQFVSRYDHNLMKKAWAADLLKGDAARGELGKRGQRDGESDEAKQRKLQSAESSSSETTESEQPRKKRRKEKAVKAPKAKKPGYYQAAMAMNQMMGMSMMMNNPLMNNPMMNNPLAMMAMARGMPGYAMPGYNQMNMKQNTERKRRSDKDSKD